jgi:hypothetical protein
LGLPLFRLHPWLFLISFAITVLLFRSLIGGRSLVPPLLAVRLVLLIIALLVTTGGWHRLAPRLIRRTLLFLPQVAAIIAVAIAIPSHVFRLARFADDFVHGARSEILAGGASDRLDARAAISENGSLMATEINRLPVKVINHASAVDDRRVIHHEIAPAVKMFPETMHIAEREERCA